MTRQGSPRGARDAALSALFAPRSVAVVGASSDPAKWGHILSRRALESSTTRPVAFVNRSATEVLGRSTYSSLREAREGLGLSIDLVVLCVPVDVFVETVADAVQAGARAIVAITAGLSELGPDGARTEARAVAIARQAGAVLVGPNCLGVADTGADLQLGHALLPAGEVTILSQSGNMVLDLAALLAERGLGVARFVSVGNQADLTAVELMQACVDHDGTRAVALYVEDVVDGRAFVSAARALVAAGKPVVLLSPGRSEAAARSAVSHTGAMTSPTQIVDAACAAGGVHRVDHPVQMADLLEALLGARRMSGRRVGVLTDGGGHGAVAADALALVGLETPDLAEATRQRLQGALGSTSSARNPVDLAGAADRDPRGYARALRSLLAAEDVDGVLMTGYFGGYSTEPGAVGELELAAAHTIVEATLAQHKPVVVHTIFPSSPTATVLRGAGIPVHRDVDRAAAVLLGLEGRQLPPYVEDSMSAARLTDTSYDAAKALFADAGITFPVSRTVSNREELLEAMVATGFPLVLKALGQVHKSDDGGVLLGLPDELTTLTAYDEIVTRLAPPAVSVESMADLGQGVELIVGCLRDRTYGPVLMVGLGGIHAEVLADAACVLAPVGIDQAREVVLSLRGARLLTGARGRSPADLDALSAAVSRVSYVAASHPELGELEINPLLAGPAGVLALDARIVSAQPSTSRR